MFNCVIYQNDKQKEHALVFLLGGMLTLLLSIIFIAYVLESW